MSTHSLVFQVVTMFLVLTKKRKITMLKIFREVLRRDRIFRKQERAAARRQKEVQIKKEQKQENQIRNEDTVKLKHF